MTHEETRVTPRYQVVDWDEHHENFKSRTIQRCSFVCIPNKEHGESFLHLMSLPDGDAIYGLHHRILLACSQQPKPRQGWLTSNGRADGKPWTAASLATRFRRSVEMIERALHVLSSNEVGWLRVIAEYPHGMRSVSAEYPRGIPAVSREGNGTEPTRTTNTDARPKEPGRARGRTPHSDDDRKRGPDVAAEDPCVVLLREAGFKADAAKKIVASTNCTERRVRAVINWAAEKKARGELQSELGFIRTALEENYQLPPSAAERSIQRLPEYVQEDRAVAREQQAAVGARERAIEGLIDSLSDNRLHELKDRALRQLGPFLGQFLSSKDPRQSPLLRAEIAKQLESLGCLDQQGLRAEHPAPPEVWSDPTTANAREMGAVAS